MGKLESIKKEFDKKWNKGDFSEEVMCDDGKFRVLENPETIWRFVAQRIEEAGEVTGSTSDGYHTFDELYEHRAVLFIQLCGFISAWRDCVYPVWRSKLHSDGSSFDGWFIMGIFKEGGKQITYHLPMDKWNDAMFAETLEKAPEFDGHTPADVLKRLDNL